MQAVGRYQIRGLLGSGGFGTVYLATDPATGAPVAVKVLDHPGDAYDPQAQEDPQWLEIERIHWLGGGP